MVTETLEKNTLSTEEAMAVLKRTRASLIAAGLEIAKELCRTEGSTHSRRVYDEMVRRGIPGIEDVKSYWLSAIFRRPAVFTWTGRWYAPDMSDYPNDVLKNCSTDIRPIRVWRLASVAGTAVQ